MAKNWALYILLAWIIVPAAAMTAVLVIGSTIPDWVGIFLATAGVYFFQFIASAIIRKTTIAEGFFKSKRDCARKLLLVVIKAFVFSIGLCAALYSFLSGGGHAFTFEYPYISQDIRYIAIIVGTWIFIAVLNNASIKGE